MSKSLQLLNAIVEIDNYDNDFLILKSKDLSAIRKVGKAIFHRRFDFIEEVIVTEVEVCLKLNQHFDPSKIELLSDIKEGENVKIQTYRLPVFFDNHEDWKALESSLGLEREEIIKSLLNTDFSIAMFGFLPGFLYLDGLDKSLHVPRKKVPSKYVETNSIAIGGQYLGVYSLDSPGGWYVIGKTAVSVLQIPELPPLLLNPEDRIILQSITKEEYEILLKKQINIIAFNA